MYDVIETIGSSSIQHGKYNNRIYLMKLSEKDFPEILSHMDDLACEKGYSKIFAKIPDWGKDKFIEAGYKVEAYIPKFYNLGADACFMGKFYSDRRASCENIDEINNTVELSQSRAGEYVCPDLPYEYVFSQCDEYDAEEISQVYKEVFKTYPFPIFDPQYIIKTMKGNVSYFCIKERGKIIALSSSEMCESHENVEMTDFATLEKYRGKGLSAFLLFKMEEAMHIKGFKTAYTIARSLSPSMNITFSKLNYRYAGTLINNTNISGGFESMNVWYKKLNYP